VATPGASVVDTPAIARLAGAAQRILSRHPDVVAAYLYGSAARGEPAADLDVALLLRDGGMGSRELEELTARLEAEGTPHGPPLDVRVLAGTSPRFRANVLRDGQLLFEADRRARLAFEARAMSEWLDFKPTWLRMRQLMLERWASG
jgi:uncharacterized protein